MPSHYRRFRSGLSDRAAEVVFFIAALVVATGLIFAGAYAYTTGSEVELAGIGDLDIIGSGIAAIGFLVFGFNFFLGLRRLTALDWSMFPKAAVTVLYCLLSVALVRLAWFMGTG